MATKDLAQDRQQVNHIAQEGEDRPTYHWVYETPHGQDIDIQITLEGYCIYTIETPWYRAQVRTYDVIDTVVRFCQAMYGAGKLAVILI